MGTPDGTSYDAMLVDLAVPKQSFRFEMNMIKLQARLYFRVAPKIEKLSQNRERPP